MTAVLRMRWVLPLVALIAMLALTAVAGLGFAKALQRPVEYRYFDEALTKSPDLALSVNWHPGPTLDRNFGTVEAFEAGRALTEAWALHAAALATQNTDYLADRFSGTALTRAITSASQKDIRMVVLHHEAQPIVFHRDGSVLQIADRALTVRFVLHDRALQDIRITNDANITTLVNEFDWLAHRLS